MTHITLKEEMQHLPYKWAKSDKVIKKQNYIPQIGDRVLGIVHPYLTHVWIGPEGPLIIPTEKICSGVIVKKIYNFMFLIKTDGDKLLASTIGYIYKPS